MSFLHYNILTIPFSYIHIYIYRCESVYIIYIIILIFKNILYLYTKRSIFGCCTFVFTNNTSIYMAYILSSNIYIYKYIIHYHINSIICKIRFPYFFFLYFLLYIYYIYISHIQIYFY